MIFARVVLRVSCGYVYIYILLYILHIFYEYQVGFYMFFTVYLGLAVVEHIFHIFRGDVLALFWRV